MGTEIVSLSIDEVREYLKDFCTFGSSSCYVALCMARPKENNQISHNDIPVFREIITSKEEIDRKVSKLSAIGSHYEPTEGGQLEFRLYITVNSRDVEGAFFQYKNELTNMIEGLINGHEGTKSHMKRLDSEWISTLQSDTNSLERRFIIDIDKKDEKLLREKTDEIERLTEINVVHATPNGFHIITEPFNYNNLDVNEDFIEIKTDGLLYLGKYD